MIELQLGEELTFAPPIRLLFLSGGIKCISGSNGLNLIASPCGAGSTWTDRFGNFPACELYDAGQIRPIIFSVSSNESELNDPIPQSYPCLFTTSGNNLIEEQAQRWSGLSTAYKNKGNPDSAFRAERIGLQIRLCVDTLKLLVHSYDQTASNNFSPDLVSNPDKFQFIFRADKFSIDIGYKIQICLNELFALRDFLIYFITHSVYNKKCSLKKLKNLIENNDILEIRDILLPALSEEGNLGIIAKMSLYRNIFFHFIGPKSSPLGPSYHFRKLETQFGLFHRLVSPLYDDIDALRKIEREQSIPTFDDEEAAKRFMTQTDHIDALEFCFDSLSMLLTISERIESKIDTKSESLILTQEKIISMKIIDQDDNISFYEKDADGNLVETLPNDDTA